MFYATIDSSLYKTCKDKDGESENKVIITPTLNMAQGDASRASDGTLLNIDTYYWEVLKVNSNYKNAINKQTFATVNALTSINQKFVAYEVSNIQDGEVVYIQIACSIKDSANPSYLIDLDYEYGSKVISNQTVYRGDPVNTAFRIFTTKNGKIEQENIYDNAIERTIKIANKADRAFFSSIENTTNGSKENISEFLTRWESKNSIGNETYTTQNTSIGSGGYGLKTRGSVTFAKDEKVLYAHGRSLDLDSIESLLYQNPKNSIPEGTPEEADRGIYLQAMHNRRSQDSGYNSFLMPMFNPGFTSKGIQPRFYFPERSSHPAGNNNPNQKCGTAYADVTWTPPSYPVCPSNKPVCAGHKQITVPFCVDLPCQNC
jgi:hypothetical protein